MADIMAAADSVAGGDLSVRVRENTPGELGQLARSFNHMLAELERAEQQRRNLTADVAHELRTPLHIIQGNLEGILDGVYEPSPENITATLDETRVLTRLISDLQTLSLAEAGQLPLHKVLFSASDLLSDVATSFTAQSTDLQVNLRVETRGDADRLGLYADPDRMDQVISNLVDPFGDSRVATTGTATLFHAWRCLHSLGGVHESVISQQRFLCRWLS